MVAPTLSETQLKDALKLALIEVLEERSDLLRDVLAEVMEDFALARAIQEDEASELVSRDEIFGGLEAGRVKTAVRMHRSRLAEACALLDPTEERALAEEGWGLELDARPEC